MRQENRFSWRLSVTGSIRNHRGDCLSPAYATYAHVSSRIFLDAYLNVTAPCQENQAMNATHPPALAERSPNARRAKSTRSRISNGAELFIAQADGRSKEARRFRDVYADLIEHAGGDSRISEARRHLVKRATALIVWAEVVEARLANGEALDTAAYSSACNTLRRLLGDIGLDRTLKDVTPSLGQYLEGKRA